MKDINDINDMKDMHEIYKSGIPGDEQYWGPCYWFFLHSVARTYPNTPNDTVRRKYYDLIQNFPLFIPHPEMSNGFLKMLDAFPVSPYLGSRDSFMKWVFFVHNKYNSTLEKYQPTFEEANELFHAQSHRQNSSNLPNLSNLNLTNIASSSSWSQMWKIIISISSLLVIIFVLQYWKI